MASPIEVLKGAVKVVEKREVDSTCLKDLISRAYTTQNLISLKNISSSEKGEMRYVYDDIIRKVCEIAETYMGKHGKFEVSGQPEAKMPECICKHVKEEAAWLSEHKDMISHGYTPIKNMLEDLDGLYSKTIFKLEDEE